MRLREVVFFLPLTIIIILFFFQKSIPFLKVISFTIFRPGAIPTHRVGTAQKREKKERRWRLLVRVAGLEPARSCDQQILSLWCLPIPPYPHVKGKCWCLLSSRLYVRQAVSSALRCLFLGNSSGITIPSPKSANYRRSSGYYFLTQAQHYFLFSLERIP